ncbi:DMT family transporter [Saccharospirillum impatiens]|uniref:DMT family transporter n=1 Tax=Saccharospirillum impatiens TaxID=169438 RepID=UPI0004127132|nr:DMT family transporter [Saccharospirillum impatiens]
MSWIGFTLLAAFMQAIRTAGQKQLSRNLTAMSTTLSRYLFGLPVALLYTAALWYWQPTVSPHWSGTFFGWAGLASVAQIGATWCLVTAFQFNNFAVGTTLAKTEALQTALIGWWLFGLPLALLGWFALVVGFAGVLVMGNPKTLISNKHAWRSPALMYGLAAGALFAVASLSLRMAALSLNVDTLLAAGITLSSMVLLQTVICGVWVSATETQPWQRLWRYRRLALFIGITSALGSIGWFTAMTLHNPALVKTLGQVEFLMTLAITRWVFHERIHTYQAWGMVLVVASVLLLLQ